MKEQGENKPEKERQRIGIKAYSIGFGIGSLIGTAVVIWLNLRGLSTVFVFASFFGAVSYQLKIRSYDNNQ